MITRSLVLTGVVCVVGCGAAANRSDINESRREEDRIKSYATRESPASGAGVVAVASMDVRTRSGRPRNVSSLEVTSTAIWAVDNNRSTLLRADRADATGAAFEEVPGVALVYPYAIKVRGERVFISDDKGIQILSTAGEREAMIDLFYSVFDFAPVGDGALAINPVMRAVGSILVRVNGEGRTVARWGSVPDDPVGALKAAAYVASCGNTILAAMVHTPRVHVLRDDLTLIASVDLPFPGLDELRRLEADTGLVNPSAGVYRLPTYSGGAVCVGDRYYVVADLPRPWVYVITPTGQLETIRSAGSQDRGSHILRASGVTGTNGVDLFALVETTEGRRAIRLFAVP